MWTTTEEALLGIALAVVCALMLAIAIDWSRAVRRSVYPLMVISQTIPLIALAPLVIIWFGFGIGAEDRARRAVHVLRDRGRHDPGARARPTPTR